MSKGQDSIFSDDREAHRRERIMILDRFLTDTQLDTLGAERGLPWFEDDEVGFENRGVATEILASELSGKDLQRVLNDFDLEESLFPWFLGRYYTAEWLEDRIVVSGKPDKERRHAINSEIAEKMRSHEALGSSLESTINDGYFGLSEVYANVRFYRDPYTETEQDHECAEVLEEIPGMKASQKDTTGYRLRVPLELVYLVRRAASGVLPAEEVTVGSEVFGLSGDPEEVFLSALDGKRVSKDSEVPIDDSDMGHGYMRVQDTKPDGPVEINDQTDIYVEIKDDRASVMADEVPKGKRIAIGMADIVVKVLRDNGGEARREEIVDMVDEWLTSDMDVYHLIDRSHLGRHVRSGLRRLGVRGEVYETDGVYRLTSKEGDSLPS